MSFKRLIFIIILIFVSNQVISKTIAIQTKNSTIDNRVDGEDFIEGDKLEMYQCLVRGWSLKSASGNCYLSMQLDGNLVIYKTRNLAPLWATHTHFKYANRAYMEADGNLNVYGNDDYLWWSSKTKRKNGAYVKLQNSGNLEMFTKSDKKVWETKSNI
ncbi:hypothetical protein PVAND_014714 [Polypedilum vanderplanki]|uniref:Bulb-type lectin domain-containing protein n=1 Tax=Polypedilum vanderplanki TaxID=319348 RepID=A0A9J6BAZ8_POLVA|nr:hypothetical protein PVAND_014714 [Polypedilum vanderplanki]